MMRTKKVHKYDKREDGKNDTGRPKKKIDKDKFEALCKIQCTKAEICEVLDCDEKTITRFCKEEYNLQYKDVWKIKSSSGKASIRRMQFKAAEAGNPTMLIWLGKQYLGQSDKQDLNHEGGLSIELDWVDNSED